MNKFQDLDILRNTDLTVDEVKRLSMFADLPEAQLLEVLITIKEITQIAFNYSVKSQKGLGKEQENS